MENEKIYLRKILLDTMDTYIRNIVGDDDITDAWLTLGMPDEYTDKDLTEIAEDTCLFRDTVRVFYNLLLEGEE